MPDNILKMLEKYINRYTVARYWYNKKIDYYLAFPRSEIAKMEHDIYGRYRAKLKNLLIKYDYDKKYQ